MACCALAAFLIGQFLLLGGKFRTRKNRDALTSDFSAAAWRPGLPSAATARPMRKRGRRSLGFVLAGAGIAGMAGAALAATKARMVEIGQTGIYVPICGNPGNLFNLTNLFGRI